MKNKVNGDFPATVRKVSMSKVSVLALLGLCTGAAHAQSSVTMYGSLDGGLRNVVNGTPAGGAALTMASNGVYDQNRWGFRGVEDLGGGLKAVFNLEAGFVLSQGTLDNTNNTLFQRRSTVGLEGPFGRVDLGRMFAMQHYLIKDFEPFDFKFLSITEASGVTNGNSSGRDPNAINYTGAFGPTVFRAEYALGGVAGSVDDGSTRAVGFNYRTHTVKFGFGYTHKSKQIVAGTGPFLGDNEYTAGGAYTLGPVTALGGWSLNLQNTATAVTGSTKNQYLWGGLRYQITPFIQVIGAYYDNKNITAGVHGRKDVSIVGVTYALSKKTLLYADFDYTKYRGGEITNITLNPSTHASQTGISFGMNHLF
ncbi:porin [Paraburkholderia solisilvae]|uniref:Outer membrane porin protein 32 n=1 Tax=Paraburkholderia solisilvae TaxID=624376 RepID=A0A6J5DU96_9BURK|nr:porin [Paraburkholderia solisilvae]CAB3757167.1 Outer membrane porin protein 32 [Paraburkholderia solisilvae]